MTELKCPHCGNKEVDLYDGRLAFEDPDEGIRYEITCSKCDKDFIVYYKFMGIE